MILKVSPEGKSVERTTMTFKGKTNIAVKSLSFFCLIWDLAWAESRSGPLKTSVERITRGKSLLNLEIVRAVVQLKNNGLLELFWARSGQRLRTFPL